MPELPDVTIYVEKLAELLVDQPLERIRIQRPFALRSVSPKPADLELRLVTGVRRMGKRIVVELQQDLFIVIHLMIAGRLLWRSQPGAKPPGKIGVAAFDFPNGTLLMTEASSKKRASIHLVRGQDGLKEHMPGGADVFAIGSDEFRRILSQENRTLKRALTNPHWFDGIGNAYSDEILHAARLSPMRLTSSLSEEELERLLGACRRVLSEWIERLRSQFAGKFPGSGEVTAFRPEFAVHGKYGKPCPVCGRPVQRIVYADNETNYCAECQNEGRILADRSLSRLLKGDFPRGFDDD